MCTDSKLGRVPHVLHSMCLDGVDAVQQGVKQMISRLQRSLMYTVIHVIREGKRKRAEVSTAITNLSQVYPHQGPAPP